MSAPAPNNARGGFVLGLVVMLLFAIAVAGASGYLVVNTEFSLSTQNRDGREALSVARAGLQRFISEQLGMVGDSVSYAIGDGIATVTTIKLVEEDSLNHLYYIRSEGNVLDLRTPNTPAKRVVGAYAWHRIRPLAHHAAVMIPINEIEIENGGEVVGVDSSTVADCSGGGASTITGAIATNLVDVRASGYADGNPVSETWSGGYSEMYDSVGLRWDILSDPSFPVDIEQSWNAATFAALPADSFPLVRYNGSRRFNDSRDGRGVLIVTGEYDASSSFDWDGIILAGEVDRRIQGQIRGLLVGGLNGPNPGNKVEIRGDIYYYSCNVYKANDALSYLELLDNTIFEAN